MRHALARLVYVGVVLLTVGLAANSVRLLIPKLRASSSPAGQMDAYTVVLRETIIGTDGQERQGGYVTYGLRSDGARLFRLGRGNDAPRYLHFPNGDRVETNDYLRRVSTQHGHHSSLQVRRDAKYDCLRNAAGELTTGLEERVTGHEYIAGYRTARIETAAKHGATFWFALDRACAMVQSRMSFKSGGASEQRLVELSSTEPDAQLFSVDGYAEGPPSALGELPVNPKNAAVVEWLKLRDKHYYDRR